MNARQTASDELKNAFADQELAASERRELQERALHDVQLRHELCEITAIKGLVRDAYEDSGRPRALPAGRRPMAGRLVAVALLCVATGWVAHAAFSRAGSGDGALAAPAALASLPGDRVVMPQATNHDQVLLHVSTRDPEDLRSALDAAESMLARARDGAPATQVEIVANSAGIDLFRSGVSPQAERIAQLLARYPSLRLIACRQSMDRARERGESVVLLPGVDVVPTALDEIIARLQKGWVYVRT
jgi:intracellular sulfur oxidation DsrE/DsrF family protein